MDKLTRSNHIHHCHKNELRERIIIEGVSNSNWYPRFCYHCNHWLLNTQEWSEDCERHMNDPPVYCNVLQYRHVLIRPGHCPFCLGDEKNSATFRFKTFRKKIDLKKHLDGHLRLLKEDKKLFCPHPKCRHNIDDETLMDHFESIHSITPAHENQNSTRKSGKRKRDANSEETKAPKKKSRKTNNSTKSQDKHSDTLSLNDQPGDLNVPPLDSQFEDIEYSNWSSPSARFEDSNQESLFIDGWEKE